MRNKSITSYTGNTGRNSHTGQLVSAKGIVPNVSNPFRNLQAGQATVPKSSMPDTGHSGGDYHAVHVAIIRKGPNPYMGDPLGDNYTG